MQPKFYPFILFLLFCFSLSSKEPSSPISLHYTIEPYLDEKELVLEVRLKFQAQSEDATFLFLPSSWGSQEKLYKEIILIESLTPNTRLDDTEKPDIKIIRHSPHEKIEIRYCIKSTHCKDQEWYYRPILEKKYFFFFGHCFFVAPETDFEQPAKINLEWKGFPDEMALANSFGAQERKQKLYIPISHLYHSTYCGGDFTLYECGDGKSPIYLAVKGKWSFSIDHLSHLVQTIIDTQRSFWNDHDFPCYLITVMPSKSESYIAGTALTNAFSIFIADFHESSRSSWNSIAWLLSHEHFHTWNGMKMRASSSAGSMTWFTEGFTEYYAAELNLRANIITLEEYLDHVNRMIYDYYASPVRNIKNRRIEKTFWSEWTYQRLPYVRGFLLALNWNDKIKTRSNSQLSLDDGMLALFKKVDKPGKTFNLNHIQSLFKEYLGSEVEDDLEDYIKKGKTIPLRENIFEEIAAVEWMPNVGFNLKTAKDEGWIDGVIEDSPAYKAGLRNGYYILDYQTKKDEIQVHISKDKIKAKTIKYRYDEKSGPIPQFTLFKNKNAAQIAA